MSKKEYPQELLNAQDREPDSDFVQGCFDFFNRRGFLSDAQKNILRSIANPAKSDYWNDEDDYDFGAAYDWELDIDCWD